MEASITIADDLPNWQQMINPPSTQDEEDRKNDTKQFRFRFDQALNTQIKLWVGDITKLQIDAIVNSTNETMDEQGGLATQIVESGGKELKGEISRTDPCRTGESRITKGYLLPAKHIIHTVGPRYNEKYKTAAENALHGCYKSSLTILKENNLTTIEFPVLNSQKRGFPPENGAHIAIRTVRRFLEHYGQGVAYIVFCLSNHTDETRYKKFLPLYFPRNYQEELYSREELPRDIGNEFGETVIEERKIKINAFPTPIVGNKPQGSAFSKPATRPPKPNYKPPDPTAKQVKKT